MCSSARTSLAPYQIQACSCSLALIEWLALLGMLICFAVISCSCIVRWNYDAKNHTELTVRKGDEVEIIEPGSKFKVLLQTIIAVYSIKYPMHHYALSILLAFHNNTS